MLRFVLCRRRAVLPGSIVADDDVIMRTLTVPITIFLPVFLSIFFNHFLFIMIALFNNNVFSAELMLLNF